MRRAGILAPARAARALYRGLGRGIMELLWLAGAGPARRDRVLGEGVELAPEAVAALEDALGRGPVLLAATHTGSWELAAYAAARHLTRRGRALSVVAKPMGSPGVDAFVSRLRRALGLHVISPAGALASARAAFDRGEVVAMPIDQVPERPEHGLRAPFLGAPAWVDRAPATVAARAGATLLVTAAVRRGGRHRVEVLAAFARADGEAPRAFVERATRDATRALEAFVRREPDAWLWLHRRWRDPRPPRDAVGVRRGHGALVASGHPG